MSQLNKILKSTSPDMVYYDIVATNFQSITTKAPRLRFNESRSNPIISATEDYYMSIVRFSLDTYNLPNIIAEIQPKQADAFKTIYSLTLQAQLPDGVGGFTTSERQVFINWIPQNKDIPTPPAPISTSTGFQPTNTEFYYCYNFQYFIDLINNTFDSALLLLKADTGGAGSPINTAQQPIMTWDTTRSSGILNAPVNFYESVINPTATPKINIFFNKPLFALFNSFNNNDFGVSVTAGKNHQIIVDNVLGTQSIQFPYGPAPTLAYSQVFQETSTIDTWTPVSSIVFTSNTIPIVSNQLSAPLIFNDGQVVEGNGNNSNFAQIITDLETNQQVYKPQLLYNPTAEFRRIDMTGNRPLTNIDIEVYWRDKLGGLNPLSLESGGSATIKFLFEKKDKIGLKSV